MGDLIDDYVSELRRNLRGGSEEKDRILREVRGHLRERVADLRAEHPDEREDVLVRRALRAFGDPEELALAYTDHGVALQRTTGETVLEVTKAVGRGTGKVLKWTGIVLGVLLVIAGVVGVWAFYEVRPVVEQHTFYEIYDNREDCPSNNPCNEQGVTHSGYVHPDATEVRFGLTVQQNPDALATSQVTVTLRDAQGDVKFQRTYSPEPGGIRVAQQSYGPVVGDWVIEYDFTLFQGWIDVEMATKGVQRSTT